MPRPTKRAAAARLVATYAALLCSPHLGSTRWFRKRSFSPWNLNPAKWPWGHFLSQVPLRAELYRALLGSTKMIYSRKLQVHILRAWANGSGGNGLGGIEDGLAVCNEKQTMDVGMGWQRSRERLQKRHISRTDGRHVEFLCNWRRLCKIFRPFAAYKCHLKRISVLM